MDAVALDDLRLLLTLTAVDEDVDVLPDPATLVDPNPPVGIELGGDWSSYWYDGRIYESDIRRGLIIWKLSDAAVAGAKKLGHLNPQTAETSFALKRN